MLDTAVALGTLVRLVGNPDEIGSLQQIYESSGRHFAKVQFPGSIRRIPLDQIEEVPTAKEEPIERLRSARFAEPGRLRQILTHIRLTGRLADIFYSMEASGTDFHAHQFKPVVKILSSPTDSILVADEVGLGKTIEAGLIWTELQARLDYSRLLVVCPKILCRKWQLELSTKFGIDARILSPEDLLDLLRHPERASRGFVAICGIQGLQPPKGWNDETANTYNRPPSKLARLLSEQADEDSLFDVLVVDEAHHLRNPETQRSLLGRLLRSVAQYKIFLSATPIQLRERDLFSLLSLLDPDTFRREQDLINILRANEPLIAARDRALASSDRNELVRMLDEATQDPLLEGSHQLQAIISELMHMPETLNSAERARLAGRIEQVNLLANIVNRTRRRDVQELRVVRQVTARMEHMTPVEREVYDALSRIVSEHAQRQGVSAAFLLATPQRMLTSCLPAAVDHWLKKISDWENEDEDEDSADWSDRDVGPLVAQLGQACRDLPSPTELSASDSKFAAFRQVIRTYLDKYPDEKVVVFSTFRPTLKYLERRLRECGIRSVTIDGQTIDREAALSFFRTEDDCRVLLSSEVGSEGVDLQFSRTVVNYDMPWNPMRVEQRIGRVDRLGQNSPTISVINLFNYGTIDERIYSRLYERLEICKRALGDFEAVLGDAIRVLTAELLRGDLSAEQQIQLLDQKAVAIANNRHLVEQLENEAVSLIAHGDHVLKSIHAARDMQRWISADDLARYIQDGLDSQFSGSRIRELGGPGHFELNLVQSAREAFQDWLRQKRLPRGGLLDRDAGPILCHLGRPATGERARRQVEQIGQSHPFIRFLAEQTSESDALHLRPAVSARVVQNRLRKPVPCGRYVIAAELWRFQGQVDVERLAYAGMDAHTRKPIADDEAEALANAVVEAGSPWLTADLDLDCHALAEQTEAIVVRQLELRFDDEQRGKAAEQQDRAAIQLRNLQHRFRQESTRLEETIDRMRRLPRVKGNLLAANVGRLRKLRLRYEERIREIEQSKSLSSQREAIMVLIVEVTR